MTAQIDNIPILERVKHILPTLDNITRTFQIEHAAAARIYKLMLLSHAAMIEMAESVNQAVTDTGEMAEAQADIISSQLASMKEMIRIADKQADAQTVILNEDVYLSEDEASIQHVLEIASLPKMSRAARGLSLSRLAEIVDALLSAMDRE